MAVLGPVEVRRDGARLVVPSGKTTEVLVRLALDATVLVRTDRLIEDLWSDQSLGTARNTLQSKVSKLRRVLGAPGLVMGGSDGYTLDVDPACVDAIEVLRLAESAASLRQQADPEAVVRVCATALAMFRGEILPNAGDGPWVAPFRARLEETRVRLTEDHLAARIDLGATGDVVAELEGLLAVHPLREGLWELLITSLYRSGRQADALAAYRRVRRLLSDELGLDPGARLQALAQRVLLQDQAPHTPAGTAGSTRDSPAGIAEPLRGNLPGLSASLIGRGAQLAAVTELVGRRRLVTIVGPAGVGKTRLAIEVATVATAMATATATATGVAGGAWLVRLESARTEASVWQSVGEGLDVSAATEAMVLDRLRDCDLLLVLDNCEHLVELVVHAVGRMLGAAPGLRVLATSQLPLGLDGERVYPLEPLTIKDSVALFTQRAMHQRPLRLDGETGQIVEAVCRCLDGLPLAIELAAARTKVLSVREIARRLGDRFTLLNDPTSHRPPRQRTLRAAIAWSYDLLFPDDQRGLWALACFAGGATLGAVEGVLAALGVPAASGVDVVDRLADRSLLSVDASADGSVRYRLLDSVREFSLDRLTEAGVADVALGAHAAWFAALAVSAERGVRGPEQAEHLQVVRAERSNIDAALAWTSTHDPVLGLRIANGFGWAWVVLGAGVDAARRIRAAVTAADIAGAAQDRAYGLLLAGWLEASGGDLDQADADIEQAMRMGGDDLRGMAHLHLSFVRIQQGRPHDVLALLAGCLVDFQRLGRTWEEGGSWILSAWAAIALGELARGKAACDEALRLLRPLRDDWTLIHAEGMLGGIAQAEHRFADAAAHLERAAAAAHHLGFAGVEALHLTNLGRAYQRTGDHVAAITTLERAIVAAQATGDLRMAAMARVRLGRVLRATGEQQAARAIVLSAQQWYGAAGGGDGTALAEYVLATLDLDDGAPTAGQRLTEVLAAARRTGDLEIQVLTLDALARVHAENDRPADALATLATADSLIGSAHHLVTDNDRIDRDRARCLLEPGGQRQP